MRDRERRHKHLKDLAWHCLDGVLNNDLDVTVNGTDWDKCEVRISDALKTAYEIGLGAARGFDELAS